MIGLRMRPQRIDPRDPDPAKRRFDPPQRVHLQTGHGQPFRQFLRRHTRVHIVSKPLQADKHFKTAPEISGHFQKKGGCRRSRT